MYKTGVRQCFLVTIILVHGVMGGFGTSCDDVTKSARADELATGFTDIQASLPELDLTSSAVTAAYDKALTTLCTVNKTELQELEALMSECPMFLLNVGALREFKLLGKNLIEFATEYGSVDEFCECTPYLMDAWRLDHVRTRDKVAGTSSTYTTTDLQLYCSDSTMQATTENVQSGLGKCSVLLTQAGMTSNVLLADLVKFISTSCPTFRADKLQCAVGVADQAEYKQCITQLNSATADSSTACKRRYCAIDYIEPSCDVMGRNLYIDAVNLQREQPDIIVIGGTECPSREPANGTTVSGPVDGTTFSKLSIVAALGTVLLHMVL